MHPKQADLPAVYAYCGREGIEMWCEIGVQSATKPSSNRLFWKDSRPSGLRLAGQVGALLGFGTKQHLHLSSLQQSRCTALESNVNTERSTWQLLLSCYTDFAAHRQAAEGAHPQGTALLTPVSCSAA